jgi:hypothetical protein
MTILTGDPAVIPPERGVRAGPPAARRCSGVASTGGIIGAILPRDRARLPPRRHRFVLGTPRRHTQRLSRMKWEDAGGNK